jgi:hypothetical protein
MYRPLPFQLWGVGARSYGDGSSVAVTNPFSSGVDLTKYFVECTPFVLLWIARFCLRSFWLHRGGG